MQQALYLRRLRDFGEKISDTFLFLKRNWKKLFGIYAVFVVPFLLIAIVVGTFFANHLYAVSLSSAESLKSADVFTAEFFVIILCFLLAGTSYNVAIYSYFRLYEEQNGIQPTIQQVGQLFVKKFLKVFVYNIVVSIVIGIIFVLPVFGLAMIPILGPLILFFGFILGFLFVMVVLFYLNCVFVVEDYGLSGSVSRLFYLLGSRWWSTIGFTIVVFLIYWVFSMVIQFALSMIMSIFSVSFISSRSSSSGVSGHSYINLLALALGFLILLNYVFYLLVFCGVGVNYYSLTEEKDGSAIESQIDSIGETSDKYGGVEEQY